VSTGSDNAQRSQHLNAALLEHDNALRILFTMDLFSPSTRLQDILESRNRGRHRLLQELNLNVSTEELLSAERAFTYADLYAMLGNEDAIAWLTPRAAVACEHGHAATAWNQLDGFYRLYFSADGIDIIGVARSEYLSEICDIVVRLLAASVVHALLVRLSSWTSPGLFINAPTLEYLMEQCQSLQILSFKHLKMDEHIIRVLGGSSGYRQVKVDSIAVRHMCRVDQARATDVATC
jgi:hypothetical protein